MAKPINLYQGAAPAAMSQMGAGLAQAGANIGQSLQQGYQSLGQGLASGVSAVADAYKQYKNDEAKFNATKKMYKAFGESLDEDTRKEVDSIFADTSMSIREKNALAPTLMQYLGASNQYQHDLAKQQAGDAAAKERALLGIQARAEELGGPALPSEGGTAMPGAPFYDQGLAPQQPVNPFGSLLKKRHFGGN